MLIIECGGREVQTGSSGAAQLRFAGEDQSTGQSLATEGMFVFCLQ
jgi:hypothetical protein